MKKFVYVLRDELSGEVVNIFLAHNHDVAKVIIERAIEKQPLFGKMSLYCVGHIDYSGIDIKALQPLNGKGELIEVYKPPKESKRK